MTQVASDSGAPACDAVRQLVGQLERYAGRLGQDVQSVRVRTSLRALARAFDNGDDPLGTCRTAQAHLARLSPGGVTPLLRQTMRNLRAELGAARL